VLSLPEGLHGAYLRPDLTRLIDPRELRSAIKNGLLRSFSRTVLIDPRRATEFRTRAAASLLSAGPEAVLSGHTALVLQGCSAADAGPIHVLLPYHRKLRSRPGLIVHQGRFEEQDVTELGGLRVLSLDVALAEVLCRGRRHTAIACADQALATVPEQARDEFRAWTENRIRTRPDPRGLLQGLELLNLATGLADSPAESWTLLNLVDGGLPVPEQQVKILDLDGNEIYLLDFGYLEPKVAIEYDGYASHQNRKLRDAARDEDLRRRGWIVIRSDAEDLKDPSRLIAEVKAALQKRGLA
jgi:Protein of unknown function (DUF559)